MNQVWSPSHTSVGLPCPTFRSFRFWVLFLLAELLLSYVRSGEPVCLRHRASYKLQPGTLARGLWEWSQ